MKGKVFILEDDASICGLVKLALEMNGHELKAFSTVKSFIAALDGETPDVALLDVMLPDGSGLDALGYVKSHAPSVSCVMLSALSKEEDKVTGLNLGADDYVTKPFSVLELVARVNARLRDKQHVSLRTAGNVTIDLDSFTATVDGETVKLNKKEFELLKVLVLNQGKVLTREKLLSAVWGYDSAETRTLDNHIARLRKAGVKIETVFGVGYKLL